jgi:hypothetical protein
MGAHEPQTKNTSLKREPPQKQGGFSGGEGGIRTREPLWVTRFPSVRAKPDYATSPFSAGELYHVFFRRQRYILNHEQSFLKVERRLQF